METQRLQKYARLIARKGANVQEGQEVFIQAELDQPEFIRMLVEECYLCGASKVVVDWSYQPLLKLHYQYRSQETLNRLDSYEEEKWRYMSKALPARIYIISEDPDGLAGIDPEKMAKAQQSRYPLIKPYREAMENHHQWCIAAAPGKLWAKKVFPDLDEAEAVERLWQAILDSSRIWDDPEAAWEEHNRSLKEHCAYMNSLGIRQLHYTSKNGTDFTVGMIPGAQFCGGGEEVADSRVFFNPNIPTEECFISPMRGEAEGTVYSTRPLCYQGQLIDKFWIRFHEGKAVEWQAETNQELLTQLIQMDEGSAYLGECALVPYTSPIQESGLLFYNTLFDENAACHLALGKGFADTIVGFQDKSLEECQEMGVNDSMIHEDFMIGSADMNIDAICEDGRTVPIFRDGNWAF